MKAISIKQPWAHLICAGIKDIENRTWTCPKKYIGQRVLIHASGTSWTWHKVLNYITKGMADIFMKMGFNGEWLRNLQTSAIIGSVEVVNCVINHPSVWAEKGVYNWVFANPVLFLESIPAKGKLSFWDFQGIGEVIIKCPNCGSHEIALENYTTTPFPTYIHHCDKCGYVIMESEWDVVLECTNKNTYGLHEYRDGCIQNCDDCDYCQPILKTDCDENI